MQPQPPPPREFELISRAESRARHKHRMWTVLSNQADQRERVRRMDDSSLLKPMSFARQGDTSPIRAQRKVRRDQQRSNSTVVTERVHMALSRGAGLVRSTLEVDDLMLFVSQVHPLKLLSIPVRRALCEQVCARPCCCPPPARQPFLVSRLHLFSTVRGDAPSTCLAERHASPTALFECRHAWWSSLAGSVSAGRARGPMPSTSF